MKQNKILPASLITMAVALAGVGAWVYQTQIAPKSVPPAQNNQESENQVILEPFEEQKLNIAETIENIKKPLLIAENESIKADNLTKEQLELQEYLSDLIKSYDSESWYIHYSEKFGYRIKLPVDWSGTEYYFYNQNIQKYTGKPYNNKISINEKYIENAELFFQEKTEVERCENFYIENFERKEINNLPVIIINTKKDNSRGLYYYFKLPTTIHASSQKYRYNAFVIDFSDLVGDLYLRPWENGIASLIASSFEVIKTSGTERDKQLAKLYDAEYRCPWSDFSMGERVQFKDGAYSEKIEGSSLYTTAGISLENFVYGDFDGSGTEEIAAIVYENPGGSGIFASLQIISDINGKMQSVAFLRIDDRPRINSIAIKDDKIILDLIVHAEGDPGCCPNQKEIWSIEFKNGDLIKTILESNRLDEEAMG